jgi:hypothetical protein
MDLGDWFRFALRPAHLMEPQGTQALRIPVVADVGARAFAAFHVDLVTDLEMTGEPETVPPLVYVDGSGLTSVPHRAYPVVDHIAHKVYAIFETHVQTSGIVDASSRYRTLSTPGSGSSHT